MPTDVGVDQLRQLINDGAQIIEVLPAKEYEAEHLVGAINVPLKTLNATTVTGLARHHPVVVYCWDYL